MKKILLTFLIYFIFLLFFLPFVQSEERSVTVKPKEKRDLAVETKKGLDPALLNTKYHAIIIGNNNYKHLQKLKTAVNDAKDGENFAKLARKNSDDKGSGQNGGDLGFFSKGMMVSNFEKAAFGLKKGEISDVVDTEWLSHNKADRQEAINR